MNNNDYTGTKHQRDTHVEDATIYEPGDRVKGYLGARTERPGLQPQRQDSLTTPQLDNTPLNPTPRQPTQHRHPPRHTQPTPTILNP